MTFFKQQENVLAGLFCPLCDSSLVYLKYRKEMQVYYCRACCMMFQTKESMESVSQQIKEKLYSRLLSNLPFALSIARERLDAIKNYCGNDISRLNVLEVGCGTGALASLFVSGGAEYVGIEPSTFLYKDSINNFPSLTKQIKNVFIEDADLPKQHFDLIVMVDTLEHIQYPRQFLKKIMKYLKNNGTLYIEVPNEACFSVKGYLRRLLNLYDVYPSYPDHFSFFTTTTLMKMLAAAGWQKRNTGQISILGNLARMKVIFKGRLPLLGKLVYLFFKLTKIDLILGQGNLFVAVKKADNIA